MAGYGSYTYESPESRALKSITADSYNKDQAKNLIQLNQNSAYMAQYLRKLQKGVDDANQNVIEQFTGFISDIIVLLGGGTSTGLDFGDLKYVFQAWGALFGFTDEDGNIQLPMNLFASAWHFFSTYIVPLADFGEAINGIIDSAIAFLLDNFGEVPILGEALQQLAVWLTDLRDVLGGVGDKIHDLISNLTGGLEDAGAALAHIIETIFDTWIKPIIDAISLGVGGVGDLIGGALGGIVTNISKIFNLASGADSKATQALGSTKPLWETLDGNGETTTPLSTADATMVVDATHARAGFMRCKGGDVKSTISCIAFKTGTVTTCNFDVYRLEIDGSATKVYTGDDQSANLDTTATVLFIEIDEDDWFPTDVSTGYMVICRMTGSGSVTLQGRVFPTVTVPSRPLYPGVVRDSSGTASPDTISAGTLDSLYVPETPYFQLGTNQDILPQSFFVDFSTLSSTLWISKWLTTQGIPFHIRAPFVSGGFLRIASENVTVAGWNGIVYRYKTATKNCRVGIKLAEAPTSIFTFANLFSRIDFSSYLSLGVASTGLGIYRVSKFPSVWPDFVEVSTNSYNTFAAGDWLYLEHDDTDQKLRVYKNPVWTDPNYRDPIGSGGSVIFSVDMSDATLTGFNTASSARSGGVILREELSGSRSAFVDDWILEDWISQL